MKRRAITAAFVLLFFCALSPLAGYNLHMLLSGRRELCSADPASVLTGLSIPQVRGFTLLGIGVAAVAVAWMLVSQNYIKYRNGMMEIVPGLWTPEPAGQGQYGTARWATEMELSSTFSVALVDAESPLLRELIAHGYDDLEEGN